MSTVTPVAPTQQTVTRTLSGQSITMTQEESNLIDSILDSHKGFVSLRGYTTSTGYVAGKEKVSDFLVHARPNYSTILKNRLEALKTISFDDLDLSAWVPNKGKDACATAIEQFQQVFSEELAKAIGATRGSASHVAAHDKNSVSHDGIKIWLNEDRSVKSILLNCTVETEKIIEAGERKKVNSGSKVLMRNAINKIWNKTCTIKTFKLSKATTVAGIDV